MRVFFLVCVVVMTGQVAHAQDPAQAPDVPREYLDRTRRLDGDLIRFCIFEGSVTAQADRAVVEAIADVLLIDVEVVSVTSAISIEGLDFVPLSEEQLYIRLSNDCEAFMAFTLAPNLYPAWLTVTRPYMLSDYVAVARSDGVDALSAVEPGDAIATSIMSEADVHLLTYLDTLPEERRWRRFPYPHAQLAIERVLDTTAEAALIWAPSLHYAEQRSGGPSSLQLIDPSPLTMPKRLTGMALRSDLTYLRTLLDGAIAAASQDGILDDVYDSIEFPAQAP